MPVSSKTIAVFILALASLCWCHTGQNLKDEAAERAEYLKYNSQSLASCAADLKASNREVENMKRRQNFAGSLRQSRGIESGPYLRADSVEIPANFSPSKDSLNVFGDQSSCILQPEMTEGPFYVNGELIRKNVVENERGIPLALDITIMDTTTCKPVTNTYVDIWHCNATGVYGGVVAGGNGDSSDLGNVNNTALRGLQKTDNWGIVQFETIFPGHYVGRANHIHVLTHDYNSTTLNKDQTVTGLTASHVGQIFFDQRLQAEVEANEPYTSNRQALTLNKDDMILSSEINATDSILNYVQLGKNISNGLIGWIIIGIDPSKPRMVSSSGTVIGTGPH